jgi:hypothetical protein
MSIKAWPWQLVRPSEPAGADVGSIVVQIEQIMLFQIVHSGQVSIAQKGQKPIQIVRLVNSCTPDLRRAAITYRAISW